MSRSHVLIIAFAVLLQTPALLLASPSGLNNIPTADFAPEKVLVLQAYGTDSNQSGAKTTGTAGFKYGLGDGWEVGADYGFAPTPTGPIFFQAKKTWPVEDTSTRFCLGLAGITDDVSHRPAYPYAVISQKLSPKWRGHGGYAPQKDNKQWFLGTDYTVGSGTMLRSDVVRGTTHSFTMYSLGALVPTGFGAVEGWVTRNHTNGPGSDATLFTLKLDYAFQP